MTWTVGGVTLPFNPVQITDTNPARADSFASDGQAVIIIVPGLDVRTLSLRGIIYVAGQTNAQLEASYLAPLRVLRGTLVTVSSPDGQYDGDWVLASFSTQRDTGGTAPRYVYTLTLLQGEASIIL